MARVCKLPRKVGASVVDVPAPCWHRPFLDGRRDPYLRVRECRKSLLCRGKGGLNLGREVELLESQEGWPSLEVDCRRRGRGLLARDSAGGVENFDVDIAGAADSLTGDVMVTVIIIVVVVLMSASVSYSARVWSEEQAKAKGEEGREVSQSN